jgi:hypothetical protein
MRRVAGALLGVLLVGTIYAQPAIRDQTTYRPQLDKALEPLKTLNEDQMRAVAGLVLAAQAGFAVDQYCPPLKQFAVQQAPCRAAMISYARARADCKKDDPRACPGLLEAEANWAGCETRLLGERLQKLKLVSDWPKPKPKPVAK